MFAEARVLVFANPPSIASCSESFAEFLSAEDRTRQLLIFERRSLVFVDSQLENSDTRLHIREKRGPNEPLRPLVTLVSLLVAVFHRPFERRTKRVAAGRIIHRSDVDSYVYNARA